MSASRPVGPVTWERWLLLADLEPADAHAVLDQLRPRRFQRGEAVIHEGDSPASLYLVDEGHAAVRVVTPAGDTALVRVLGPGDHFGELALLSPGARTANVDALDELVVLGLDRVAFDQLRRRRPQVDVLLRDALVQEVRRLTHCLTEAYHLPAPDRVARRLAELARVYGTGSGPITVPLSQEDLAELAGTTRPTVNRVLRALADEGLLVHRRRRLELLDVEGLARFVSP